jgi:hypothetical protein
VSITIKDESERDHKKLQVFLATALAKSVRAAFDSGHED